MEELWHKNRRMMVSMKMDKVRQQLEISRLKGQPGREACLHFNPGVISLNRRCANQRCLCKNGENHIQGKPLKSSLNQMYSVGLLHEDWRVREIKMHPSAISFYKTLCVCACVWMFVSLTSTSLPSLWGQRAFLTMTHYNNAYTASNTPA